jgi:hypothetical protein
MLSHVAGEVICNARNMSLTSLVTSGKLNRAIRHRDINNQSLYEIFAPHFSEDVDVGLMGSNAKTLCNEICLRQRTGSNIIL